MREIRKRSASAATGAITVLALVCPNAFAERPAGGGGAALSSLSPAQAAAVKEARRELGSQAIVEIDRRTDVPSSVAKLDGSLTGPSGADPESIVRDYLADNSELFGLDEADIAGLRLGRSYAARAGTTHLVFEQTVAGIPALGAGIVANVAGDGRLINVFGPAIPDLQAPETTPALSAADAREAAADAIPGPAAEVEKQIRPRFRGGGATRLVVDVRDGRSRLAWRTLAMDAGSRAHEVVVDAESGETLSSTGLSSEASDAFVFDYYPGAASGGDVYSTDLAPYITDPGGEALEGDFVYAFSDVNDDSFVAPDEEVFPSADDDYEHPYIFFDLPAAANCPPAPYYCSWDSTDPFSWDENMDRAGVQAFFQFNLFHDHLLSSPIEFDASKGAYEGDTKVWASANTGADTDAGLPDIDHINNAFFSANPGGSPLIAAFLYQPHSLLAPTAPTVNAVDDGSLMWHEYTHGLSAAIVSDAQGVDTMNSHQARSLGEAWSDWYAMDYAVGEGFETDTATDGEITFSAFTPGGREQDVDCAVGASAALCPAAGTAGSGGFTYGDMGKIIGYPETHADGEIWAQTLWDLRRRLIADLGAVAGLDAARLLVTAGMELSPPDPTFLEQRNAILQADFLYNSGDAFDAIWDVFAARGMGLSASTQDSADTNPKEDFSVPPPFDPGTGTIAGTVKSQANQPIAGATVRLGAFGDSDTTDSNGAYSILDLPAIEYGQVITDPIQGFDRGVADDVVVNPSQTTPVNFTLQRDWAASAGGASVSAQVGSNRSPGCPAGGLIDQSFGRGWHTYSPANPVQPGNKSATISLPQAVDVTAFAIDPGSHTCFLGETASLGGYRIEVSSDGATFSQVANGTFAQADIGERRVVLPSGSLAPGVRFVRIVALSTQNMTQPYRGAEELAFTEVQVYGTAVPAANPPPVTQPPVTTTPTPPTTTKKCKKGQKLKKGKCVKKKKRK